MGTPQARTETDSAVVRAALAYAAQGIPAFPLPAGRKLPPPKGWTAITPADPEAVRASWSVHGDTANIAIHCKNFLVLDVDAGKGGEVALEKLQAEHEALPETPYQHTPGGGGHLVYACPGGVPNSVEKIGPGIDVRSDHGYILVAPSKTDKGAYKWDGGAEVFDFTELARAPDWLVDLCRNAAAKEPATEAPAADEINADTAIQRAREWLAAQDPAIEGQGGDARTYEAACKVRDFGVPRERAAEALEEWNARCAPPWAPAELQAKIDNAYRYGQNAPGTESVEALFDIVAEQPSTTDRAQADAAGAVDDAQPENGLIPPIQISDVETPTQWPCNYLVKDWINQGSDAQLFGEWGQGKTFVALNLAAHIAAGQPWFGSRVAQGGVLYLLYEGIGGIHRRLAALKNQFPEWCWASLPFTIQPMNAPLVDENAADQNQLPGRKQLQAAILAFAQRHGAAPRLLVVDTYSRAIGADDSKQGPAQKFAGMVGALQRRYGLSVLRIHHPGHGDKSRGRGASSIPAGVDSEIRIGDGAVVATKERDSLKNSFGYRLKVVALGKDQDGDEVTSCVVEPAPLTGALDLDPTEQAAMTILRQITDGEGRASRRAVLAALREAGIVHGSSDREKATRLYKSLQTKRFIEFDSTTVVLQERGPLALFDDFEAERGAAE